MNWIKITEQLPPFDKEVIFKGLVDWRIDERIQIFNDKLTTQEDLEYGHKAYVLHNHSDFLVSQNPEIKTKTLCTEFITHWMEIPKDENIVEYQGCQNNGNSKNPYNLCLNCNQTFEQNFKLNEFFKRKGN